MSGTKFKNEHIHTILTAAILGQVFVAIVVTCETELLRVRQHDWSYEDLGIGLGLSSKVIQWVICGIVFLACIYLPQIALYSRINGHERGKLLPLTLTVSGIVLTIIQYLIIAP